MTSDDDDILTGPVPLADAEATPTERAQAKTFGDIVDKTLSGRTPAAMSADDRALLEVATVIRAASGTVTLAPAKQRSLVEDALRQAIGGESTTSSPGGIASRPIVHARGRAWMPWMISGASVMVAAAAILMLWLRVPPRTAPVAPVASVPASWKSRPTDALIGPIAREQAGDASSRIDYIFADRLDGFRERRLAGGKP